MSAFLDELRGALAGAAPPPPAPGAISSGGNPAQSGADARRGTFADELRSVLYNPPDYAREFRRALEANREQAEAAPPEAVAPSPAPTPPPIVASPYSAAPPPVGASSQNLGAVRQSEEEAARVPGTAPEPEPPGLLSRIKDATGRGAEAVTQVPGAGARLFMEGAGAPFVGATDPNSGKHVPGLLDGIVRPIENLFRAQPIPDEQAPEDRKPIMRPMLDGSGGQYADGYEPPPAPERGWRYHPDGSAYWYEPPNESLRHPISDTAEAAMQAPFAPGEAAKAAMPDSPWGRAGRNLIDIGMVAGPALLHGLSGEHGAPAAELPKGDKYGRVAVPGAGTPPVEAPSLDAAKAAEVSWANARGFRDARKEATAAAEADKANAALTEWASSLPDAKWTVNPGAENVDLDAATADIPGVTAPSLDERVDRGAAALKIRMQVQRAEIEAAKKAARPEARSAAAWESGEGDVPRSMLTSGDEEQAAEAAREAFRKETSESPPIQAAPPAVIPGAGLPDLPPEVRARLAERFGDKLPSDQAFARPWRSPDEEQASEATRAAARREAEEPAPVVPGAMPAPIEPPPPPALGEAENSGRSSPIAESVAQAAEKAEPQGAVGVPGASVPVEVKPAAAEMAIVERNPVLKAAFDRGDLRYDDEHGVWIAKNGNVISVRKTGEPAAMPNAPSEATLATTERRIRVPAPKSTEEAAMRTEIRGRANDSVQARAEGLGESYGAFSKAARAKATETLRKAADAAVARESRAVTSEPDAMDAIAKIKEANGSIAALKEQHARATNRAEKARITRLITAAEKSVEGPNNTLEKIVEDAHKGQPPVEIDLGKEGRFAIDNHPASIATALSRFERKSERPDGVVGAGPLMSFIGAREWSKWYDKKAAPAIINAIGLNPDKYAEARRVDPGFGDTLADVNRPYLEWKADQLGKQFNAGLNPEQVRLAALMGDEQSREHLHDTRPDEHDRAANDPAVTAALAKYKTVSDALTEVRKRNGGTVREGDYVRRIYEDDPSLGGLGSGPDEFNRIIRPTKLNNMSREATAEWFYENGTHDLAESFKKKYVATMLADAKNRAIEAFRANATALESGADMPDSIKYIGDTYYSRSKLAEMEKAGTKPKGAKAYEVYNEDAGRPTNPKLFDRALETHQARTKAQEAYDNESTLANHLALEDAKASHEGALWAGKSAVKPKPRLLGPEPVVTALTKANVAPKPEVNGFIRKTRDLYRFVSLTPFGPAGHMANLARSVANEVGALGVADPRGTAAAFTLAFDKEIKKVGLTDAGLKEAAKAQLSGTEREAIDVMAKHNAWPTKPYEAPQRSGIGKAMTIADKSHEALFGPGGWDQRARLIVYKNLKERFPELNGRELSEHVRSAVGDYNREAWTEKQKNTSEVMTYPGWDFARARWVVNHPVKAAAVAPLVTLALNRALHASGANRDEDKNDLFNVHIGDHSIGLSVLRESMADLNPFTSAATHAAGAALQGKNATEIGEGAIEGLKRTGGRIVGSFLPPISVAPVEGVLGKSMRGGDIVPQCDRGMPGRFAPKAVEDYARWAADRLLPPIDSATDTKGNLDLPALAGRFVGATVHHDNAEDRLHRNIAEALTIQDRIASEKKTDPDPEAAMTDAVDPRNRAYEGFRRALIEASTQLHQIDEAAVAVRGDREKTAQLAKNRALVLENAERLNEMLQQFKAAPEPEAPAKVPGA